MIVSAGAEVVPPNVRFSSGSVFWRQSEPATAQQTTSYEGEGDHS